MWARPRFISPFVFDTTVFDTTVFDTTEAMTLTGSQPDKDELINSVSGAWIAFAHSHNPSHDGIPKWKPHDTCTLKYIYATVEML